jgi:NTP pyrophosphatase (non-canonical NTP hydrolase)
MEQFDSYQELARMTANDGGTTEERLTNWALGLTGEAGEVADIIKKVVFHGHELDKEELKDELGDTLWYIANLAYDLDLWFSEIPEGNIEKLRGRYPEGFSQERSINRNG